MSHERVYCNLCGSRIRAGFENQWKHLVKKHPVEFLSRITPYVVNPNLAREKGVQFAEMIRRRM